MRSTRARQWSKKHRGALHVHVPVHRSVYTLLHACASTKLIFNLLAPCDFLNLSVLVCRGGGGGGVGGGIRHHT
jgi:hypothetical protein